VTRMGRPDRRQAGFTVLELVVLLVMIGVLLGVGIPVFINYLNSGSDTAAQSNLMSALDAANAYYATNQSSYAGLCPSKSCGGGATPAGFAAQGSGVNSVSGGISSPNAQTVSIWNSPDGLEVILTAYASDTHDCWVVVEEHRTGRVDLGLPGPFPHLFGLEKAPLTGKTTCNADAPLFRSRVPDVTELSLTGWPSG
jgi:type II secretory pathway pseudopilin PulG